MESEDTVYLNYIEKILHIKINKDTKLNDRLLKVYMKLNDYLDYSRDVFEEFRIDDEDDDDDEDEDEDDDDEDDDEDDDDDEDSENNIYEV